jgi:site-specific DNA-methyltransferase (adenine-specific)
MPEKVVIGNAELWHGDCREVLPLLPKHDLLLTDPPYGINFDYAGYKDTRSNLVELVGFLMCYARNQANRAAILCGITQVHLYPSPEWIAAVTWDTTGSFGKLGYTQWMPILFYGTDVGGFGNVEGLVTKSDVFRISGGGGVGFARKEEIEHPCPKPVNLMNWCVSRFSLTGERVCDPFMGSGTTGVSCTQMARAFTGIERERRYFDIACERIARAQAQGQMFPAEPIAPQVQESLL